MKFEDYDNLHTANASVIKQLIDREIIANVRITKDGPQSDTIELEVNIPKLFDTDEYRDDYNAYIWHYYNVLFYQRTGISLPNRDNRERRESKIALRDAVLAHYAIIEELSDTGLICNASISDAHIDEHKINQVAINYDFTERYLVNDKICPDCRSYTTSLWCVKFFELTKTTPIFT